MTVAFGLHSIGVLLILSVSLRGVQAIITGSNLHFFDLGGEELPRLQAVCHISVALVSIVVSFYTRCRDAPGSDIIPRRGFFTF
jgi:hypothetical protein